MGFLGSLRKKSPLFRVKRKRNESAVTFSSTCEYTDDTSVMEMSVDSYEPRTNAISEDTQELLSPQNEEGSSFVFDDRPIMVSDLDTDIEDTSSLRGTLRKVHDTHGGSPNDVDPKRQSMPMPGEEDNVTFLPGMGNSAMQGNGSVMQDEAYVSASSGDEADVDSDIESRRRPRRTQSLPVHPLSCLQASPQPLTRCSTPPNALLPTHHRVKSDGQLLHVFHDDLATLYERDDDRSDISVSSMSDVEELQITDEFNIRARWDYALQLMVGQCDASGDFYESFAAMMPSATSSDDMEVAEI